MAHPVLRRLGRLTAALALVGCSVLAACAPETGGAAGSERPAAQRPAAERPAAAEPAPPGPAVPPAPSAGAAPVDDRSLLPLFVSPGTQIYSGDCDVGSDSLGNCL